MEFIDGIKISDIEKLKAHQIDPVQIGNVGVDLYLKQILEYGFFHADPHPGNIFVMPNSGQICFIDFGMMGTIMPNDEEALGELLLNFMRKDTKKIIPILEKIAIKTEIPDYKKLEYDLYELIEDVSNTSIKSIKLEAVIEKFKNVLYQNKVTLPHYLYMLMRALVIIEGVGLKLDPNFNINTNLQPFMATISRKKFSIKRLLKKNWTRVQNINALIDTLPEDVNSIIHKIKDGKLTIIHDIKGLEELRHSLNKASNRLVVAIIIAALSIGSALLVIADMPPKVKGIPLLGAIGFTLSAILGFIVVISIFRNNKL
ncbi:Phosphotransferase enzyme family protein [Winogradskyella thalassocola]|uniref:Phosphotransferase enzyme family protein n=2 Tax=Winogradskyella thalassocola TaxID=262004 RepID=A0A1G8BF39_9FLAO|nr:Phosphotransferase enzyme family protein [Winogradskyella thalassocola]